MTFRRALHRLRKEAPPVLPVTVRRVDLERRKLFGYCELAYTARGKPAGFWIALDRGISGILLLDTLAHEWAHCLAWDHSPTVGQHSPEWGVQYARCYRLLIDHDPKGAN